MAWWRCYEGPAHQWQAQVRTRTIRGTGCPVNMNMRIARLKSGMMRMPNRKTMMILRLT